MLVLTSALLLRPSIRGRDGFGNYVYLMSLLTDGDLDFTDDYAAIDRLPESRVVQSEAPRHPATGLPSNRFGVGSALLWAPFVVPVHLGLRALAPSRADGLSRAYVWAVGAGSAFWGSVGLGLLYLRLRRQAGPFLCALSLVGLTFATPLGFYLWAHGSMSHAPSFFLAVAALLLLERAWERPVPAELVLLGAVTAGLVLTRFQDITWAVAIAGGLAVFRLEPSPEAAPRSRLQVLLLFTGGGVLIFLPQLAVWKVLYGDWLSGPVPYLQSRYFSVLPRHLWQVLLGGHRGVLLWHPLLLVAMLGVLLGRVPSRRLWWVGLTGLVLQLYLVGTFAIYWAGASFGNRFFISSYPFLAFGLVWVWARLGPPRVATVLTGLLVAWNAGLLVQYATGMMSRERPVRWGEVVHNQFTTVPRFLLRGGRMPP